MPSAASQLLSTPLSPELRERMISDLSADTFVSAYDANEDVVRLITAWTVVFQNVNDIGLQFLWDQIKPEFKTANKNASVLPRPTAANAAPSGAR